MINDIAGRGSANPTTTVPVVYADKAGQLLPEFLRLPRSGQRCPVSGLSRSKLNELILGSKPAVKSVVLRKRGTTRGIRLIDAASLVQFLRQQPLD